jgi:molybdopterin/thiamine biosynthesis adenylyltransferase
VKVVVVGVGALGSHVVQLVRNLDVKLVLVDFDRVEQRNVQSQFHGRPSVGKSKVQSLGQSLQFLFGLKVETNPHKLTADNVEAVLGKADLVLDCLDNGESRRLVQRFVRDKGIPCLHGALSADGLFGQVLWDEDFIIDDEDVQGQATCEGGEFLPFIGVVSSLMALAVQAFVEKDRKVGFNASPSSVTDV